MFNRRDKNYKYLIKKIVDTDKSGFLEANELEQVMNNVAVDIGVEKPTKDEVEEVLKELGKKKKNFQEKIK
jgi:hypothetical protein